MDIQSLNYANKIVEEIRILEHKINCIRSNRLTISIDGIYQNDACPDLLEKIKTQSLIYFEQRLKNLYDQLKAL